MTECDELERTHALADGELPADEAERARAHLATCGRCQAELADLVQLDLAVAEAPRQALPAAPRPVTSIAWYRRRAIQIGGAALAAAAGVAIYFAVVGRGTRVEDGPIALALAPKRLTEARLSWGEAKRHRGYDVPRAGDAPRESVPLTALAALEQRGDKHGVGVLAILNGDTAQAAKYLEQAGGSADVLADRAALALAEHAPERALAMADAALAAVPGHTAATWNRALALRDLGLALASAEAFRSVAERAEPGWGEEAAARATTLADEIGARRALAQRVLGAMRSLTETGTGLDVADVRAQPGLSQLVLYDVMRAAQTPERLATLKPLFEPLGADARATLARTVARPALAATYAAIIAGKPPVGAERAKYLAALRAAKADELLLGALIKLSPDGKQVKADELAEFARLAAASPDPWFRLLGLEQEAWHALRGDDLPRAEAILLRARAQCDSSAPGFRCLKIESLLGDVYREWERFLEERAVVTAALARARRDSEWLSEIRLLPSFITVAVADDDAVGAGLPLIRAYGEEVRLRSVGLPQECDHAVWTRAMAATALVNQLRLADARKALAEAPDCTGKLAAGARVTRAFVQAHLVREAGDRPGLEALRRELAEIRALAGAPSPAVIDHIEGRASIELDPDAGRAALRRAIIAGRAAPPSDANSRRAMAFSYTVLAVAAGRRNDPAGALSILAEEQTVNLPEQCVVGLAADDQRTIAVVVGAGGESAVHYDEGRRSTKLDAASIVPAALAKQLAACRVVDVIARSPVHGVARLLPDDVAWRYLASRRGPVAAASDRELVVADVEPPAALGLPRLAHWGAPRGERIAGSAATPRRVLDAISTAGIATIHAHGLVDLGRPEASFLALSADADGRYALTAADVRSARFAASPVVILAACRSSQAAPVLHQSWSLPDAFVYAGARAVIASAAPIPDADAPAFFDDLRARIAAGTPVAVALRDARRDWLAKRRGDWVRDVIVFE